MFNWKKFSLAKKILCIQILIFVGFTALILIFVSMLMNTDTKAQLHSNITQVSHIVEGNFKILAQQVLDDTKGAYGIFEYNLTQKYGDKTRQSYKKDGELTFNNIKTANLYYNGVALGDNTELLDTFHALSNSEITFFVKADDGDFIRIQTSLKDSSGKRLVGTNLGREHPAFAKMNANETFYGRVNLFGKDYMSIYVPITNEYGEVIGIIFVAHHLSDFY